MSFALSAALLPHLRRDLTSDLSMELSCLYSTPLKLNLFTIDADWRTIA
jgi:hypothetical protein